MPRPIYSYHATNRLRERIYSQSPGPSGRRTLQQRRQTDALCNPPSTHLKPNDRFVDKATSGKIRRAHSDKDLDDSGVGTRKKAPRGVAPIDDFPETKPDEAELQKRFDPNSRFDAFYDSCCYSVEAENFGNWPMAPKRDMNPNAPATKLELTLKASNLKDRDVFSKSDPICVIFEAVHSKGSHGQFAEIGRTECVKNCLNPEWNTKVVLDYFFEERQRMKFEIYDIDNASQSLSHHDFLGRAECDLAEIVAAPFSTLTLPLKDLGGQKGTITIHADELNEGQKESISFIIYGRKLDKKDFFGKSDPFLNIYRLVADGTRQLVHRTEVIKRTLNPEWKPFNISVRSLCQGNKDRDFLIECYDYDNDGGHDLIGVTKTTVNKLASGDITELELINEKKQKKKGSKYQNSGVLHIHRAKLEQEFTFLDFIYGGLQLDFTVSVDFTASNGNVTVPTSLHYCNAQSSNEYQMAIKAVLEICQSYNKTKKFNAYGFGAQIPPNYATSHLFPLNLQNPEVDGIDGMMQSYNIALRHTNLYGPTNFAPTINEAAKRAAYYPPDGSHYQILLIITDGVISDMNQTKNAIIMASTLPLSIIIVGVGDADFEKMDELDSDDEVLTVNGRTAKRDIVQFVPFRRFMKKNTVMSAYEQERLQYLLAKEVLAEVPGQVVAYMKSNSIAPRPPREAYPETFAPSSSSCPSTARASVSSSRVLPNPPSECPYPDYPPANPPAYSDVINNDLAVNDIELKFQQQVHVKASAPYF
uniref:C2 domain-containing protein n=1 Tax=Panagrolaimus sp. JU765 TaxID=591449 RepID=A0AC34RA23_9BILA